MSDDYDKVAELVRNGYSLEDALNHVGQTVPDSSVAASAIDTSSVNPVIQTQSTYSGSVATGTTLIPLDNTIPQNTEGDEYLSVTITPKSSTNRLVIKSQIIVSNSSAAAKNLTSALFQDSTASGFKLCAG